MSKDGVQEEPFSSDEEFDDHQDDSDSSIDVDAKLAEDDVFDIEFLKCYSALKKKDERIYNKDVRFFSGPDSSDSEGGSDKDEENAGRLLAKPPAPKMTLLDHQLGLAEEELEEAELLAESKTDLKKLVSKSFYEAELDEIKQKIKNVDDLVDSESDDDFLIVKSSREPGPSKSEPRKIISKLLNELEGNEDEDINHLRQMWSNPDQLSEEDKFLRDYILNKRYVPSSADDDEGSHTGFFSKNLENLSDAESDTEKGSRTKKQKVDHHSEEQDFDKIARIPRNSTRTIRDLVEKRERRDKRLKRLEKAKRTKSKINDADCEDIIGDLPTKFHYRETEPNDFGLSAEELLMATDEELERWVKLKDTIAYRSKEEELSQKRKFEERRHDIELKRKIFKSIYGDGPEQQDGIESKQAKSRKRNSKKSVVDKGPAVISETQLGAAIGLQPSTPKTAEPIKSANHKRKRHKRGLNHKKFAKTGVAPDRLLSYGLSKTKLKKSKLL